MKDYPFERVLRDARILLIFEGTNEILRLFVALMGKYFFLYNASKLPFSIVKIGIQTAGKELRELVKQLRNPFANPNLVIRKSLERWRHARNVPKLTLRLNEFLHPSLEDSAKLLEYSVARLKYVVEILLQRHGAKVVDAQLELQRIANIAIDIYVMTAVLSRASRSYCTGITNADTEVRHGRLNLCSSLATLWIFFVDANG